MPDHLARARELRLRATKCQISAKSTTSAKFSDCYRLLAEHYVSLATLEEDFVGRQTSSTGETISVPAPYRAVVVSSPHHGIDKDEHEAELVSRRPR